VRKSVSNSVCCSRCFCVSKCKFKCDRDGL